MEFYKGKKVLVTGHTGFKGSWLCLVLSHLGADVTGYALNPSSNPSLYSLLDLPVNSVIGDIRDFDNLKEVFDKVKPEIVFHMAAQPIVLEGYRNPRYTFETNIMGTVNVLECIRTSDSVKSFVNVTTDKVYANSEKDVVFTENMPLDGFDPYSNSKSCSDLITHSYARSFLRDAGVAVSTVRAGNVIGGGDFATDRIIPDCVRAAMDKGDIKVRNPYAIRPYQHVIEALFAYLLIAKKQYEDSAYQDWYNVGPDSKNCIHNGELCDLFCKYFGDNLKWINMSDKDAPFETNYLKLDCTKIKETLNWKSIWSIEKAIENTVLWTKAYMNGEDVQKICIKQIEEYMEVAVSEGLLI